jgi:hypothetical protein
MVLTWKIETLNCKPSFDGKTDVVETIHWRLNCVEGQIFSNTDGEIPLSTDGYYATSVYGSQKVTYKESISFIDYNNLTEEILVQWVKDALGEEQVATYEASVNNQLEALKNPTVVTPILPWAIVDTQAEQLGTTL